MHIKSVISQSSLNQVNSELDIGTDDNLNLVFLNIVPNCSGCD